jgi:hypothetical protein
MNCWTFCPPAASSPGVFPFWAAPSCEHTGEVSWAAWRKQEEARLGGCMALDSR